MVKEIVSKNVVKLKLPASMRIYPVVDVSKIIRYKKLVKRQKVKKTETSRSR